MNKIRKRNCTAHTITLTPNNNSKHSREEKKKNRMMWNAYCEHTTSHLKRSHSIANQLSYSDGMLDGSPTHNNNNNKFGFRTWTTSGSASSVRFISLYFYFFCLRFFSGFLHESFYNKNGSESNQIDKSKPIK